MGNNMDIFHPTFTPVRRRDDTVASHVVFTRQPQIWSASRCHRLLRPIRSRIELLRKECRRQAISSGKGIVEQLGLRMDSQTDLRISDASEYHDSDSDWGRAKKRLRRTYGGRRQGGAEADPRRRHHQDTQSVVIPRDIVSLSGEIVLPTPLLARTILGPCGAPDEHHMPEDAKPGRRRRPQSRYLTKDGEAHFQLAEDLRLIKKVTSASTYCLYDGIYNSLETLLKATNSALAPNGRATPGQRTLFSTCLRAVPKYIELEEELTKQYATEMRASALDTPDPAGELYSELENLGTSKEGWSQLQSVSRAHGIQCICEAISEDIVSDKFASALVMLCVHTQAQSEAETILSTLIKKRHYRFPLTVSDHFGADPTLEPLVTLERYTNYTGRHSFYKQQLAHLFSSGALPITWAITSQLSSTWTSMFKAISTDRGEDPAYVLLGGILRMSIAQLQVKPTSDNFLPQTKILKVAYQSSLKTLTSLCLLRESRCAPQAAEEQVEQMYAEPDGVRQLLVKTLIDSVVVDGEVSGLQLLVLSVLVSSEKAVTSKALLLQKLDATSNASSFLCGISKCCGKGASTNGFEYLQLCLGRLENYAIRGHDSMKQIIVDTAYAFASQSTERDHLEYAESLGTKLYGPKLFRQVLPGEDNEETNLDFRWEEGICEWVTATPAVKPVRWFDVQNASEFQTSSPCPLIGRFKSPFARRQARDKTVPGFHVVGRKYQGTKSARSKNLIRSPPCVREPKLKSSPSLFLSSQGRLSDMVPDSPQQNGSSSGTDVSDAKLSPPSQGWHIVEPSVVIVERDVTAFKDTNTSTSNGTENFDDSGIFVDGSSDDELSLFLDPQHIDRYSGIAMTDITNGGRSIVRIQKAKGISRSMAGRSKAFNFGNESEDELSGF